AAGVPVLPGQGRLAGLRAPAEGCLLADRLPAGDRARLLGREREVRRPQLPRLGLGPGGGRRPRARVLRLGQRFRLAHAGGRGGPARARTESGVIVHLVDGTYELFRHFYGLRRFPGGEAPPFRAVAGRLDTLLQMIGEGATHLGVATDHVIESFRNELWSGYKTGDGIDPQLRAQFVPLEQALAAMGVTVWPMIELEADDALASAAALAGR